MRKSVIAIIIIVLVVLVGKRRWLCCAAQAIPYAVLAAGVLTFCGLNYSHYGVFALSDFFIIIFYLYLFIYIF